MKVVAPVAEKGGSGKSTIAVDPATAVILNACPSGGTRAAEARDALEGVLPIAPVELHQLVAYSDALNDGQSWTRRAPQPPRSVRSMVGYAAFKPLCP